MIHPDSLPCYPFAVLPVHLPLSLQTLAAELGLSPDDVEESFVRGTGKGGQKVNKTSSAVQLLHRPTGIEVKAQAHREQSRNRAIAWKLLVLKLEEKVKGKESRIQKEIFKIRKQKARRNRKSKEKMLEAKHRRGEIKESRKDVL